MRTRTVVATLILALGTVAVASPKEDDAVRAAARVHVEKAKVHFKLGEFLDAIAEWKEAYRLKTTPLLLFNIAQAYRMAGDLKQARFHYQMYMGDYPDAPNEGEVRQQIERIDQLILEADGAAASGTVGEPAKNVAKADPTKAAQLPAALHPSSPAEPVATTTNAAPSSDQAAPALRDPAPTAPTAATQAQRAATHTVPPAREGGSALPVVLGATAGALAVAGIVTYALARGGWSQAAATEHPRAGVDQLVSSADTKYKASLGLGGAAALLGAGAGVAFAF